MRCKMVTDRHKLFQNYLQGYRYRFSYFRTKYGVTGTDLAVLIQ